ncbi:MAG: exodeoxyribonuclease VII large subunit [Desulfobacterales bacterium]|nr:exodeoxyribonuclease VII large subunit [Desulfobacterales bacterium]
MADSNNKRFFSLSDITGRIQAILQPHIGKLFWVKAEISSAREKGGSFYCDLVESEEGGKIIAQMRCTIWSRDLDNIKRQFKEYDLDLKLDNGTAVGFQCSLQFHPQFGLSLKAVGADPAFALGELELKKKEILNRLTKEGLLEPNKHLTVPMLPQRIGLITSKGSAACNDILKTFSSSGFGFSIFLADSTVQGLQAERSVLNALNAMEKFNLDLVVIARGGGSKTDLFYLDNEAIARRIAGFKYPVWTGIGHETDISILDHVANRYFKTPTAVAEDIVARFVEMKRHLQESQNRFRSTWSYRFDRDRVWLDDTKTGIVQGTRKLLDSTRGYLLGYATTLSSKVQNRLTEEKSRIAVSRKVIATAPISQVKRANERLKERTGRFTTSYKRQITGNQKDLLNLKSRFQPERFILRIRQEKECLWDWRDRFIQRFNSKLHLQEQQVRHLSRRFRLETIVAHIGNEKTKLANKAATLRAVDPATSLKRGFSLVYTAGGDLVKSISQVNSADTLKTEIGDGQIISTVNKTERK